MSDPGSRGLSTTAKVVIGIVAGVLVLVVVAVVAFLFLVQAALGPRDGDAIARTAVDQRAAAFREELGYWHESTDAETLAARRFTSDAGSGVVVEPIAWNGRTDSDVGATVDVRITARVDAESPSGVFQPSRTDGSAQGCFRFAVRSTQDVSYRGIDCPEAGESLPTPTATPEPELADDAETRLRDVLAASDPSSLSADVAGAFPEPDVTTDAVVTDDGELVAAVGVAKARDCVVLVRRTDGTIERIAFDRIQLEPGELGCSVQLYTAPAL